MNLSTLFTFYLFYAKILVMNIINIKDKNLFYIGGVVRDEILGRKSFDIDITYVGNAIEYCAENAQDLFEIIQENPDFGTVRVKIAPSSYPLPQGERENIIVDIASTRSESYPRKGHLPVVEKIGCSLKEDVLRRDFTINALAKNTLTGEIVDYTGGLEDLKNKKLRVLHDESFIDDPTRIIRGLKFSVRFGFELDEHTKDLQDKYLSAVNYDMSYKRVKKELVETFNPHPNLFPLIRHSVPPSPTNGEKGMYQLAFEKFVNEGIYKLLTEKEIKLPDVNVENLVNKYLAAQPLSCSAAIWLVYMGAFDLSRLPLTKIEQKILDDVPEKLEGDFELYKAFENTRIETVLLYALKDEAGARRYLDDLRKIKISVTGKDLQELEIKPSPKYQKIFDGILKAKLENPEMTKEDELKLAKLILKTP